MTCTVALPPAELSGSVHAGPEPLPCPTDPGCIHAHALLPLRRKRCRFAAIAVARRSARRRPHCIPPPRLPTPGPRGRSPHTRRESARSPAESYAASAPTPPTRSEYPWFQQKRGKAKTRGVISKSFSERKSKGGLHPLRTGLTALNSMKSAS